MQNLKELLEEIISEYAKDKKVALLLSGGVDSLSLGFACNYLGKMVHAYSFQIDENESEDSRTAAEAANKMGWEFTLIKVPSANIQEDFLKLANVWKCKKKTQYECTWPFLYLAPEITEKYVLSGLVADGHSGLSKKAMMHFRYPKEKFDEFRRAFARQKNPCGVLQLTGIFEGNSHGLVAPYMDRRAFDFFMQYDHDQINKPYQKRHTLEAYPKEFQIIKRRQAANLQIVAGIPAIFEKLLQSNLNIKRRTRVMDLCRDYADNEELQPSKNQEGMRWVPIK